MHCINIPCACFLAPRAGEMPQDTGVLDPVPSCAMCLACITSHRPTGSASLMPHFDGAPASRLTSSIMCLHRRRRHQPAPPGAAEEARDSHSPAAGVPRSFALPQGSLPAFSYQVRAPLCLRCAYFCHGCGRQMHPDAWVPEQQLGAASVLLRTGVMESYSTTTRC